MADNALVTRPEFVREVSAGAYGVVQKPLTVWEKLYNSGALRKAVLLAIMAAVGAVSISRLSAVSARTREIARNWLPCVEYLSDINTAKSDMRVVQLRYVMATTPEEAAQFDKFIQDLFATVEEKKRLYVPLISDEVERFFWQYRDKVLKPSGFRLKNTLLPYEGNFFVEHSSYPSDYWFVQITSRVICIRALKD